MRGIELRLALTDQGLRRDHVGFTQRQPGPATAVTGVLGTCSRHGEGFVALRPQAFPVAFWPVADPPRRSRLQDEDVFDTTGKLGGDIDLGGFNPAVAADEPFAGPAVG